MVLSPRRVHHVGVVCCLAATPINIRITQLHVVLLFTVCTLSVYRPIACPVVCPLPRRHSASSTGLVLSQLKPRRDPKDRYGVASSGPQGCRPDRVSSVIRACYGTEKRTEAFCSTPMRCILWEKVNFVFFQFTHKEEFNHHNVNSRCEKHRSRETWSLLPGEGPSQITSWIISNKQKQFLFTSKPD